MLRIKAMKLFPKLLIFFLVSILPLYAVSWYTISLGSQTMEKEIRESATTRSRYYLETFKSNMTRILQIINNYTDDDDIDMLSNMADYMTQFERFQAINGIRSKLLALKNSSPFIKEARLFIPSLERTIDSTGYYAIVPEEGEIRALADNHRTRGPFVVWEDRLLVGLVFPGGSGQPPNYVLEVELDKQAIRRSLSQLVSVSGTTLELRHNTEGWSITSNDRVVMTDILAETRLLPDAPDRGSTFVKIDGQNYLLTYEGDSELAISIYMFVPEHEVYGTFKAYQKLIVVLACLMLLLIVLVTLGVHRFIHRPLVRLIHALRRVERGDFDFTIRPNSQDEFGYVYLQLNLMLARLKELIRENYEQKILAQRSELKQLQAQINPHFLYNSFFTLYQLIEEGDREQSLMLVKHLRTYFQFITRNAEDRIPLYWEVEHALSYLQIQQMRFEDRIHVSIEHIPDSFHDILVPRLIVQPLIENAYQHGLEDKAENGWILVRFDEDENRVRVIVEDNGDSLTEEELQELRRRLDSEDRYMETTGLVNIHRRLNIFFSGEGGLSVRRSVHGGLYVELTIPRRGSRE
jgi:two-component system sensor histidine kinase YesM